jgi:hypothetical protein
MLKLVSLVLRHDWLTMVLAFVILLVGAGTESSIVMVIGVLLAVVSRLAFIVDKARSSKKQERVEIASRVAALRAAEWRLTPPPSPVDVLHGEQPAVRSNDPHP